MSGEDYENEPFERTQKRVTERLGKLPSYRQWYQETFNRRAPQGEYGGMEPFKLRGMSSKQEQALRSLAREYGFKNMRGFNKYMEGAHVDYYDLIKVASP